MLYRLTHLYESTILKIFYPAFDLNKRVPGQVFLEVTHALGSAQIEVKSVPLKCGLFFAQKSKSEGYSSLTY